MRCTRNESAARAKVPTAIAEEDFKSWLRDVSRRCEKRWGLRLDDLPDLHTRAAFDAGVTPQEFFEDEVRVLVEEEYGELAHDDSDEP